MDDKRRDSGEYYPGGRVVARHSAAPPQIVVQWSDVQGKPQIAPLPDRYMESDMKGKINEIASKFATALAVALVGWTAIAGLVVQKAQKDQVWNDEEIVTDVHYEGEPGIGTNAVLDIVSPVVGAATNALDAAKRDKTDLKVYEVTFSDWYVDDGVEYDIYYTGDNQWEVQYDSSAVASLVAPEDVTELKFTSYVGGIHEVIATRTKSVEPTSDTLATSNGVAAAIAANEITDDGQIVRGNKGDHDWDLKVLEAAEAGIAYGLDPSYWEEEDAHPTTLSGYGITDGVTKDELSAKRDKTDNTCHKTEYGEWNYSCEDQAIQAWLDANRGTGNITTEIHEDGIGCDTFVRNFSVDGYEFDSGDGTVSADLKRIDSACRFWFHMDLEDERRVQVSATRTGPVCVSNETFVTQSFVTNETAKVAAAVVSPSTVTNIINSKVSANLNTYVDGETGVEYVGKFYDGSMYYVPTGNVYPPND